MVRFAWMDWIDVAAIGEHAFMVLGWLVSLVVTLVILPYLGRLIRLHREQALMIKKKLFEHTGVVIYGVFDKKLQSDYLGGFLTTLFGERLFDLIVHWNDEPSPSVIIPRSDCEADHMKEILAAHASPYILQSSMIECYFKDVEVYGTPSYRFTKLVVGLARPDAHKLVCHDYPRVIAIEQSMLKKLMEDKDIQPQWDTQDGYTWLETVRELGQKYFSGERHGIAVLEVPLNR